jgi:hypothetical protein
MVSITLSVPEELKQVMNKHPEMNWSEVARQAFKEKASQLELLDAIVSKSKLSKRDALEIGRKIKKGMWEKYKKGDL